MAERDGVVFYRSFWEAITHLDDADQLASVKAIIEYGLYGREPECSGVATAIFMMAKPQIDANNRRYENGTKGGRPKNDDKEIPRENQKEPSPNQAETESKPKEKEKVKVKDKEKDKDNKTFCPEPERSAPGKDEKIAASFLLNDGSMYNVTENDVEKYQQLYPGIDCMQELRKIVGWCDSNPKNRKTRNGAKRFVNGWLSRAQDKARPEAPAARPNRFHNFTPSGEDYDAAVRELNGLNGLIDLVQQEELNYMGGMT